MKETIYTIPVNEAFEKPCECAIWRTVLKTTGSIIISDLL